MPLTDTALPALKPASLPYKVTDEKGLYVLASPTGTCQWRIDYRFPRTRRGKRKTLSLGIYPQLTLSGARKRRDETRNCLSKDIHPALKQRRERNPLIHSLETTFEGVARDWLKKKAD